MASRQGAVRPLVLLPADPLGGKIGGIQSFVRDFVRFAPDDFAVEVVGCTSDLDERPLDRWQTIRLDGREIAYLPIVHTPDVNERSRIPLTLRYTLAVRRRRRLLSLAGRVLQFHHAGVPLAFLRTRAPKVQVVHLNVADIDRRLGESRWGLLPGLIHRVEDLTLPEMARVFVVNREGAEFYRRRHRTVADRVEFLPTGVDRTLFHPFAQDRRQRARAELLELVGLPESGEDTFVLFVGRLELQKDPALMIDAFALAQVQWPQLRLVVAGEGSLRADAARRAAERRVADRVHWIGYQPREQMPSLMNAADLLLLPSAFEGMPITVLEALSCGLPVVATAVGEVPTLVSHQRNGWLAQRDPDSLATGLVGVARSGREAFAEAARSAVEPFDVRAVFGRFYQAHREALRSTLEGPA